MARKKDTIINFVQKERLDQLSETGAHQGVIAQVAAYEYSTVMESYKAGDSIVVDPPKKINKNVKKTKKKEEN